MMMALQNGRYASTLSVVLIAVVTAIVYANSLTGEFVSDDRIWILDNEKIASFEYIPGYFTSGLWDNAGVALDSRDVYLYRPLGLVDGNIRHRLLGTNPFAYHLNNLLLHIVNSILVFFVLRALLTTKKLFPSLAGALLFAVHPVHVEAVSWIAGYVDLALTFYIAGAFLLYVKYREGRKNSYFICSVLLFGIALFYKEVAIVFPALILGYDLFHGKKVEFARLGVFIALSSAYLAIRVLVLGRPVGALEISTEGFRHFGEFAAAYMKLLFAPWPLHFYFTAPDEGVTGPLGMFIALGAAGGMLYFAFKRTKNFFALGWLSVTLLPSLLLAFYHKPHIAERTLYMPSIGFIMVVASCIGIVFEKYRKSTVVAVVAVLLVFSGMTVAANQDWKNDEAFYSKAVRNNPSYGGAYAGLAQYYERTGNVEKAVDWYLKAARHESGRELAAVYAHLGMIYGKSGLSDHSMYYFKKVLDLLPGDSRALTGLGNNYYNRQEYAKALSFFLEALSRDNSNYEACQNIAVTYETLGDTKNAIYYYKRFISTAPAKGYSDVVEQIKQRLPGLEMRS